jgi:hypothetical protein
MARRQGDDRARRWLAAAALSLAGCSDSCGTTTDPGAIGELGNGRFHYACGGSSDPACESSADGDDVDYFPDCIALGGGFDLEYELLDASALETSELTPVLYIESVNQRFFRGTDDFEALRVGRAAFVVRESERVLDLLHLDIVEPDDIDVIARDPATPTTALEVAVGDTEVLRVFPRNLGCPELGGAVPITAESSDTAIASVSAGDVLRIQGQAPGTAVVRARLGALEEAITVTVVEGPIGPDPGTSSEGSGATGSSDGTSSGTTDPGTSSGTTDPGTGTGTTDPGTSSGTTDPGTGTGTGTTTMGGT